MLVVCVEECVYVSAGGRGCLGRGWLMGVCIGEVDLGTFGVSLGITPSMLCLLSRQRCVGWYSFIDAKRFARYPVVDVDVTMFSVEFFAESTRGCHILL